MTKSWLREEHLSKVHPFVVSVHVALHIVVVRLERHCILTVTIDVISEVVELKGPVMSAGIGVSWINSS